ncbi:MAG: NAD(P)H-dependent oxidoreductase subunit E [Candidatus Dormibacteraeota bacterium]|nr:NAD(P)H-dependent oxidoreductase subunit E [Candidatus Dormibacteraeota bacterium]
MPGLSERSLAEIRALPPEYPEIRSAVPPALDIAQEELGHVTPEAMTEVAAALNLDPGYVEGVATFYSLLHLEPVGKHHFYLCTNLSCALRGAEELGEHMKRRMGVSEYREISGDGLFSVEDVECLGACEFAPMLRYRHQYHYDLDHARVDALIDGARSSGAERATGPEPTPAAAAIPPGVAPTATAGRRKRTSSG